MSRLRSPVLLILVLAPFLGECMSGATPPLDLLLPWNLALFVALYGCGALLCREVAVRRGLGLVGLLWFGAAYGVYEEALVDRFWFSPKAWHDLGVGGYGELWHTNVLIGVHLTLFHMAVTVASSVALTHRAFPRRQREPWLGRRGIVLASTALVAALPLYGQAGKGPLAQQLLAVGLCLVLVWRGLNARPQPQRVPSQLAQRRLVIVAFAGTAAHFLLVYSLPSSSLPWPVGLTVTLIPVGAGFALARRGSTWDLNGRAVLLSVVGVLYFFVALQALVGLAGRYDLTIGAIALAAALRRSTRAPGPLASRHGPAGSLPG